MTGQSGPTVYEGALGIWKNSNLTPMEQIIEHHFVDILQSGVLKAKRQYYKDNVKMLDEAARCTILDTDRARYLSSVWRLSHQSRALCSAAVHNPASAFTHTLYVSLLKQRRPGSVIFTAGGGGAGKSAALDRFAERGQILHEAAMIYDTTLASYNAAVEKINLALAAKRSVYIIYVYRPFAPAVKGVIDRALLEGRTVPLNVLARDHFEAPRTVARIGSEYAQKTSLQVIAVDNSGRDISDAKVYTGKEKVINFLTNVGYNTMSDYLQQAEEVLQNETNKRYIPEYILTALTRDYQRSQSA